MNDRDPRDMSREELIAAVEDTSRPSAARSASCDHSRYLDRLDTGVAVQDANQTITYVNSAASRILGIAPESILGKNPLRPDWEIVDEAGRPQSVDEYPTTIALRNCKPVRDAVYGLTFKTSGKTRWLRISCVPICDDEDGKCSEVVTTFQDITPRKQAENRLAWEQKQSLEILEQLQVGVVIHGPPPEGTIEYLNPRAAELFHMSREDAIGMTMPECEGRIIGPDYRPLPPEEYPAFVAMQDDPVARGRVVGMVCLDGKTRWFSTDSFLLPSGDDHPRVMVTSVEITEQIEAMDQLKRRTAELEAAQSLAGLGTWSYDIAGGQITWSDQMYHLFDRSPQDGPPSSPEEHFRHVHPDDVASLRDAFDSTLGTGEDYRSEYRWLTDDGDVRHIRTFAQAETDENGDVVRLAGTTQDITAFRRSQNALQESERKYRLLAETTTDVIWQYSVDEQCTYVNPAVEDLLGYTPEEFRELPIHRLYPPEDLSRLRGLSVRLASDRDTSPRMFEATMIHKDGHPVPVEISGNLVMDDERQPAWFQGVTRDISARHQAEQEHRDLQAQIQHTQKLESLGVLAGGIAHDFNNLLMGILGNADLAMIELPSSSPAVSFIAEIAKVARRAADLCNQMLAYSGKGRFIIERLDLSETVRDISHMLRASITKQAILREELDENLPPIQADPTQVRQVVMNLITNASEALGDRGGVIAVRTETVHHDGTKLGAGQSAQPLAAGTYVVLEVTDTGVGMNSETIARVFDPFFTTKFTGRGLGLAAVQGIVRGHDGAILIDSTPGKGTTFRVYLPAAENTEGTYATETRQAEDEWSATGLALLAEDEEAVRTVGQRMLEHIGFEVLTALDGDEAIELFSRHHRILEVVLLDLTMPGLAGEDVARELDKIDPDVPIILCSGFTEQAVVDRFDTNPPAAFVQKPYRLETLRSTLRNVLTAGNSPNNTPLDGA